MDTLLVFPAEVIGSTKVFATRAGRPVGMVTRTDVLEYLAHHPDGAR